MIILDRITALGGEAYYVGGCVRDMILGIEPKDYDIATNVPIDVLEKNFKTHDIGKNKDFGIVVIEYQGRTYEVAQFRSDGIYSDGRRPDAVTYVKTIEEDLARRDFTINAMAFDGENIIDPFGGQEDLKKGYIRFVGNAQDRIAEDGLRVLRAYRFAARFKYHFIDEEAMYGFDLSNISQERITEEIRKTAGYGPKELAFLIHRTKENGIILIPEIQNNNYPHQLKHHPEGDVFTHVIHCLSIAKHTTDYLTNLCILFHDIGKYETLDYKDGKPTYYSHDIIGAKMMDEVGKKLKLSNDEIETIKYICKEHMTRWDLPKMKKSRQLEVTLHKDYTRLIDVCYADEMSRLYIADFNYFENNRLKLLEATAKLKDEQELKNKIAEIVDGNKIILRFNVSGKEVGTLLNKAKEYIIENDFSVTESDLINFLYRKG